MEPGEVFVDGDYEKYLRDLAQMGGTVYGQSDYFRPQSYISPSRDTPGQGQRISGAGDNFLAYMGRFERNGDQIIIFDKNDYNRQIARVNLSVGLIFSCINVNEIIGRIDSSGNVFDGRDQFKIIGRIDINRW